ncbi:MAG: hypothetical protein AB1512_20655 [Thermodesulfobacteriota bacterium]
MKSVFCFRVVNGRLIAPYSFGGEGSLTGVYYNIRLIGKNIFARFKWLCGAKFWGYVFLEIKGKDKLDGGWWYGDDVPLFGSQDITTVNPRVPGMNPCVLRRDTHDLQMPAWAQNFFADPSGHGFIEDAALEEAMIQDLSRGPLEK